MSGQTMISVIVNQVREGFDAQSYVFFHPEDIACAYTKLRIKDHTPSCRGTTFDNDTMYYLNISISTSGKYRFRRSYTMTSPRKEADFRDDISDLCNRVLEDIYEMNLPDEDEIIRCMQRPQQSPKSAMNY